MNYFVTGATGFIGRNLVQRLLKREGTVYALVRAGSRGRLEELRTAWGPDGARVVPIAGDLSQPGLGVSEEDLLVLRGNVDHFFHLAAIYDMAADAGAQEVANVEGTRHAVELAGAIEAGCFHQVSSIAAAGLYKGTWREDMFEEAEGLDTHPYFRTKHESERVVREECTRPWRVYRPGIVVGDSRSGEIDKIDGPYYFFRLLQQMRRVLPAWLPAVGVEGGEINIVPVDFVADAIDHIAHEPGLDGQAFSLTDPNPKTAGEAINLFARAADAPQAALRLNGGVTEPATNLVRTGLRFLPPARRVAKLALNEAGIPPGVLNYVNYPTHFDSTNAEAALEGSGIAVPPLESYADKVWDYWERNLDPGLFKDRSLSAAVRGKVVLITGASSGIGKATAVKAADAGATVLLVARSVEKLEEAKREIETAGGVAHIHRCDMSDMDDVARMADEVLAYHGRVDVLVNNAGRSIRRSVGLSYERFHDYERTMQLNYFGAVRLILALLPSMRAHKSGHIVNVSSIGTQTNPPRFSAYVASKAALDAFGRVIASEVFDDGVRITTIHMPLVRTPMIAPTRMYDMFPAITPEEAAEMIAGAMISKPKKVATRLGTFGELLYAVAPTLSDKILNMAYNLFPESQAAKGKGDEAPDKAPTTEAVAFAHLMKGVHW
ncbi:MAG TPA: SDR family oxidoreductase [Solirubrobacterales bacterium]|jgi:NAD(P)-dependent dehydrogenase (short-subunit alcohol dehydrogenase family)|nr:SDR family oxidoreductase [Solirubrobacterales bacterium]